VTKLSFQERLAPGFGVQLAASLAAPMTFLAVAPFGIAAAIVSGVLAAVGLILLMQWRAPSIVLDDQNLRAGRIKIPRGVISGCEFFTGQEAFIARGRELDPRAARLLIGDIDAVVRIRISDQNDPTPYLLISTRRPEELCRAIGV
jgi:hypothetical protein